jgi:KDO2-lipid IV(A) lauroyltransferase
MQEAPYRFRRYPFAGEQTFRLGDETLEIGNGARNRRVRYADFKVIESFAARLAGSSTRYRRGILHPVAGRPIMVSAASFDRWRLVDQSAAYEAFFDELCRRITQANPGREFIHGRLLLNRAGGLGGKVVVAMLRIIRRTNPDGCANMAAWIMQRVGPRLRGHRYALEQLGVAFPDKPREELERIARGMWENLARTLIEYAQLDRLWYTPGRIEMDEASAQILADIRAQNRRTLHFSLHSANWELAAIAAPKHGIRILVPYRRMKNEALTNELVRLRAAAGTTPLTAGPDTIAQIKREFGQGDILGMLIDQRYAHGIEVTFFGQQTKINPLFARLARVYNCPIYGSRVIRRPGGRFNYKIVGPIEPVRDGRGRVDVHGTAQQHALLIEGWIREHPEQWMWVHRMWR